MWEELAIPLGCINYYTIIFSRLSLSITGPPGMYNSVSTNIRGTGSALIAGYDFYEKRLFLLNHAVFVKNAPFLYYSSTTQKSDRVVKNLTYLGQKMRPKLPTDVAEITIVIAAPAGA